MQYFILFFSAVNLLLGFIILIEVKRDKPNTIFLIFTATASVWTFNNFYLRINPDIFFLRASYSLGIIVATIGLVWTIFFLKKRLSVIAGLLLIIPSISFFLLTILTDKVVKEMYSVQLFGYEGQTGQIFLLYSLYFSLIIFLIIFNLIKEMIRTRAIEFRNQILFVLLGISVFAVTTSVVSFFIPTFLGTFRYSIIDNFSFSFFLLAIVYSILKHHLFSIKVIVAELLTFAIWIAVLTQAIMADTFNGKLLGGGTLFFAVVLGIFLIKSVKKEVAQREQIEELAGRLKSVNRIMSHDIKNVLGKNKDMYGMLLDGTFGAIPDTAKPFLERLLCDTKQLVRSVISILESGQEFTLKLAPFDMKVPVLEIIKDVSHDAEEKGLTIKTNIDESQDYTILGDEAQLSTRVFRNLIENAVNYTLAGSVTVGLIKNAGTVIFSVTDTGVGITEEDQKNLFQEGGHGKDSLKVNVHSTGYGLFSAKKVVDEHKGKIYFKTEAGKGTTFFVEMKVAKS